MMVGTPEIECFAMLTLSVNERAMLTRSERLSSSIVGEQKMSLTFLA